MFKELFGIGFCLYYIILGLLFVIVSFARWSTNYDEIISFHNRIILLLKKSIVNEDELIKFYAPNPDVSETVKNIIWYNQIILHHGEIFLNKRYNFIELLASLIMPIIVFFISLFFWAVMGEFFLYNFLGEVFFHQNPNFRFVLKIALPLILIFYYRIKYVKRIVEISGRDFVKCFTSSGEGIILPDDGIPPCNKAGRELKLEYMEMEKLLKHFLSFKTNKI